MNNSYHKPVLVDEVLEYLNIQPNKTYLDVTFGGGGHTQAILEKEPTCKVIAIDWDKQAIKKNAPALEEKYKDRLKVLWGNFALLYRLLKNEKVKLVDGILADFGTSQYQIHHKEGFSFRTDTPLDMRMSQAHNHIRACDVLNRFSEKEISTIFFELGEERKSRKFAREIVAYRDVHPFKTTGQLAGLIEDLTPGYNRFPKKFKIHPATKVFQALRIFVNKEFENIETFLTNSVNFLSPGARLLCISFHSLEDRMVKNFFKQSTEDLQIITKKPISGTAEEIRQNPSARSAKLRVSEKK